MTDRAIPSEAIFCFWCALPIEPTAAEDASILWVHESHGEAECNPLAPYGRVVET